MPDESGKLEEAKRRLNDQQRKVREARRALGVTKADTNRQSARERSRERYMVDSEIGPPPDRNEELWKKYQFDLLAFLVECFPHSTGLKPFSDEHIKSIRGLQHAILNGDQKLWIVFRGWAKSTIGENSTIWATGYGHRKFFLNLGADKEAAATTVASVQSEYESNDLLMKIFPLPCHCARALEGTPQRAKKQTINGEFTNIRWPTSHCVLPTYPGFEGSGAIIQAKGITASLRGKRFKRPDGEQARPDFVLCDDIQTDTSAASPQQVRKRLNAINKTVLRLSGHARKMACMILGTIIEPDDVLDQLSNRKLFPMWSATKVPMLKSMPKALDTHWLAKYAALRTTFEPDSDDDKRRAEQEANQYLKDNWEVMHEGAKPSWEHCFNDEELSAVQHAMNILIDTTYDAFMAECQNQPQRLTVESEIPTTEFILSKVVGHKRGIVPPDASTLTAFTDQQGEYFFTYLVSWTPDCTPHVVAYGPWPDQKTSYFRRRSVRYKLSKLYPGDKSSRVFSALRDIEKEIIAKPYFTAEGRELRVGRWCIDTGWHEYEKATVAYVSQSAMKSTITLTKGRGIGAKDRSFDESQRAKKWRTGPGWFWEDDPGPARLVIFDTNTWKSRFLDALRLPVGSIGGLTIHEGTRDDHLLLTEHWRAEYPVLVHARGRSVLEWKDRPNEENEGLDCIVGCFLGASIQGIKKPAERTAAKKRKSRQRVKYL
jgi:hypothetical protein